MKANELMIGDWVRIKITQHNTKVTNIDANSVYTEFAFPIRYDEIEPITLTPEILEKNGFVGWRDKCYRWEYAEGIYINIDFTEEEPWAHISNRCYSATPICRYVHELQHALKLFGIEKEIIL